MATLRILAPRAVIPPSAMARACTTRTTDMTITAAQGPSSTAANIAPRRWPLVPAATGKLSICAAKTKAPVTPRRGTVRSPRSLSVRRTASARAPSETAPVAAAVVVSMNPSGMCMAEVEARLLLGFCALSRQALVACSKDTYLADSEFFLLAQQASKRTCLLVVQVHDRATFCANEVAVGLCVFYC